MSLESLLNVANIIRIKGDYERTFSVNDDSEAISYIGNLDELKIELQKSTLRNFTDADRKRYVIIGMINGVAVGSYGHFEGRNRPDEIGAALLPKNPSIKKAYDEIEDTSTKIAFEKLQGILKKYEI